jgi:ABC-2 type transport system permease protein
VKWFRLRAVARKEFIHIRRDPRSLAGALALPVFLIVIFGYGLSLDLRSIPMAIWDQSQSPASRDLIQRFLGSGYFVLRRHVESSADLDRAIDDHAALIGLVIPADFAAAISTGRPVSVQVIADGVDPNSAALAIGYAESLVAEYSQSATLRGIQRAAARSVRAPLDFRPRVWFNPDLESRNFLVPGLIAIIMMVIAALLTSLTVAREWERGTMEQLISTPVTGFELILGKLIPYFSIGMFDFVVSILVGKYIFHVPLRGSAVLLLLLGSVFLVGALTLGILVSITTRSQLVANQQAIIFTFLPALVLSGFIFAIGNMPPLVQAITYTVPARYFMGVIKDIYLKGVGLEVLWFDAVLLMVFATALLWLAKSRFKKSLD